MPHIVLTEEQTRILAGAADPVEGRECAGPASGSACPLTPTTWKQSCVFGRDDRPRNRAFPQVQAHLRKLQEISRQEELDEAKVKDLLRRMRAGEEV